MSSLLGASTTSFPRWLFSCPGQPATMSGTLTAAFSILCRKTRVSTDVKFWIFLCVPKRKFSQILPTILHVFDQSEFPRAFSWICHCVRQTSISDLQSSISDPQLVIRICFPNPADSSSQIFWLQVRATMTTLSWQRIPHWRIWLDQHHQARSFSSLSLSVQFQIM